MPRNVPLQPVLIVAPLGQDASSMAAMLEGEGIGARICEHLSGCLEEMEGTSVLLLTEEALESAGAAALFERLEDQPAWSELPVIILTRGGESRVSALLDLAASAAGSVTLLERPMSAATLVRSVQVALRSRQRQCEVRDLLVEQKRRQEELRQAKDELAAANASLEKLVAERTARLQELVNELEHFSYTITHDMRAPLRAMRGLAELINEANGRWSEEEKKKFVERIITAAERMDGLITDALHYSKVVRSQLPLAPVDMAKLLRGMLETYPEFQAANADIRVDLAMPLVMGNEAGLTQCFSNLLGNAVKFVRPGERARVRVRAEVVGAGHGAAGAEPGNEGGEWVRISVEDDGPGIPASLLPRVFDMFARGSSAQAGTGIGLALVRKVVGRMGGKVGVESEEGKGSRFWMVLKRVSARAGGEPGPLDGREADTAESATRGKR